METETEQERAERVEREKERGRAKRASIFAGLDAATEGDAPLLANTLRNRERVASGRTRASLYFLMDDTRTFLSSAYTRFTSQHNPSSLSADPRLFAVTFPFLLLFVPFIVFVENGKRIEHTLYCRMVGGRVETKGIYLISGMGYPSNLLRPHE